MKRGQNYLEGKRKDDSRAFYCHVSKMNAHPHNITNLMDFMAGAFVDIIAKSKKGSYDVDRRIPVLIAADGKNIEITAVNFKQGKIWGHYNKRQRIYAIPQNYRSKDETIDELKIRTWSLWKAIGTNFFYYNKPMLIDILNRNANKEFIVDIDFHEISAVTIVKDDKDEYISPYEATDDTQNITLITSSIENIYIPYKLAQKKYAFLDHSYMNDEMFLNHEYYFNPISGKGFTTLTGTAWRPTQILPVHIKGNVQNIKLMLGEKAWIRVLKYRIISTIIQFMLDIERPKDSKNSQTDVSRYLLPEETAKLIIKRMSEHI